MPISLQGFLHSEFSRHGLVYDVSLPLSPFNQDPITSDAAAGEVSPDEGPVAETEYGFVTFYSRRDAKTALQAVLKSPISIGSHSLKVCLLSLLLTTLSVYFSLLCLLAVQWD